MKTCTTCTGRQLATYPQQHLADLATLQRSSVLGTEIATSLSTSYIHIVDTLLPTCILWYIKFQNAFHWFVELMTLGTALIENTHCKAQYCVCQ